MRVIVCLTDVPQTLLPRPPICETGAMFLISESPVLTWYLTHRLLECWMPRMGWTWAGSYCGGEIVGKANPAMVQVGNTDLWPELFLERRPKREALMVWDPEEALYQSSLGERCAFYILVSCLPVGLSFWLQVSEEMIWLFHPCVLGTPPWARAGNQLRAVQLLSGATHRLSQRQDRSNPEQVTRGVGQPHPWAPPSSVDWNVTLYQFHSEPWGRSLLSLTKPGSGSGLRSFLSLSTTSALQWTVTLLQHSQGTAAAHSVARISYILVPNNFPHSYSLFPFALFILWLQHTSLSWDQD